MQKSRSLESLNLPLIPLRDVVVFPFMVIPLFVGRKKSVAALEQAVEKDKRVFLVAQKDLKAETPERKDLYDVGVIATVLQLIKLPDGTVKVLVEGLERARLLDYQESETVVHAKVELLYDKAAENPDEKQIFETEAFLRSLLSQFELFAKNDRKIPAEVFQSIASMNDPERLVDSISAILGGKIEQRQALLETVNIQKRLEMLHELIQQEKTFQDVEKRVQGRVEELVKKNQRQYYLNEKMKAIRDELGNIDAQNPGGDEFKRFEEQIEKAGMSAEAKEKALAELNKLRQMPPLSAESSVSRNYLECLLNVPWQATSVLREDLKAGEDILNRDHYGLEKVKERIIEYLAVQKRIKKVKGPILCLVGPPGVGKTSLGRSIAEATGREFVRMSLGGVRDEAEIRGHRRTYVGALPGKIIQKISKAKVRNPLFMLDEIDKMAMDFRGDPASALLEVLDPEQNNAFNDHYLEVDYDLSDVMFIATANSLNIPPALLDRMEVISLAGYTEEEKLKIAEQYLIPKQIKDAGLTPTELTIEESAIREIIRSYTREAGVRNLEREIAKICRKIVKEIVSQEKSKRKKTLVVQEKNLEKYLGVKLFRWGHADEKDRIGHVTGLAWTQVGGDILTLEAQIMPGKGKTLYTGRLGDVMQESIHAAMTVMRTRSKRLGVSPDFYLTRDFHVHVPEGATPKDGPSAGIGMCTALISALTQIPVRADVAMTGEITLRGEVLPIGGLKEKLLAALRADIKTVIIPEENKRDLKEIPKEVLEKLKIHPVRWIDQVLELALQRMPEPLVDDIKVTASAAEKIVPALAVESAKGKTKSLRVSTH